MSAGSDSAPTGTRHEVCPVADLPPGERRIVEVSGLSIGVFNVDGEFHALANVCPHQLAELCRGALGGVVTADGVGEYGFEREGRVVRCPHHKWAFDVTTGESVFNPHLRTRTFEVAIEGSEHAAEGDDVDPETAREVETYGTELSGEEPPVETYDVEVEDEVVVLYV